MCLLRPPISVFTMCPYLRQRHHVQVHTLMRAFPYAAGSDLTCQVSDAFRILRLTLAQAGFAVMHSTAISRKVWRTLAGTIHPFCVRAAHSFPRARACVTREAVGLSRSAQPRYIYRPSSP